MRVRQVDDRADVRGLIRVHGLAWREAYADILPADVLEAQPVDPSPDEVDRWLEEIRANREGVLVAVDADEVVRGFVDMRWGAAETKPFVGPDEAGLKAIYVEPARWGEGIGTALLDRGLEVLPAAVERVRLEVFAANDPARRFYEARGFTPTGSGTHEVDGESYPTKIYTREL